VSLDWSVLYILIQVFFLEGILSIDNAAVLGAMVSVLPPKERVPWPRPLRFLGPPIHRILGGQQSAALKVGLLGAYVGRGSMLVLANFVINNPWLKLLGAVYLIKLAFENLGAPEVGEEEQAYSKSVAGRGFWGVVLAVELADLAFSFDNVVAVIALSSELWIVMFGVFMGILTMRFAAGIFTWLISREPILKPAAYVVVFNIGVELFLDEYYGIEVESGLKFMISLMTLVLFVVYSHVKPVQSLQPMFRWIAEGMSDVNELLDWALVPFAWLFKMVFKVIFFILRPIVSFFLPSATQTSETVSDSNNGDSTE
jgi:tellurite resistance protein TerC